MTPIETVEILLATAWLTWLVLAMARGNTPTVLVLMIVGAFCVGISNMMGA